MIKGVKKEEITFKSILSKISEYDIYRYYMPNKNWEVNKVMKSPFRKDSHPSFIIGNKGSGLRFMDFGDTSKHGNCFDFVKELYGIISMYEVLLMIDKDFGLGLSSKETDTKKYEIIQSEYSQPILTEKRYALIQVVARHYTEKELEYWKEYHQDIEDLKRENIYSLKKVFLNKKLYLIKDSELRFGYYYNGFWKIYIPKAEKMRKWLSNIPLTTVEGLDNLSKDHNSLVTKSKKDYLVGKKVYPHICYVQNESKGAFSKETIEFINNNSKKVFYWGDSDEVGKKASYEITESFGWNHINSPDRLLPEANDLAEWGKLEGLEVIEQHLILKKVIE